MNEGSCALDPFLTQVSALRFPLEELLNAVSFCAFLKRLREKQTNNWDCEHNNKKL